MWKETVRLKSLRVYILVHYQITEVTCSKYSIFSLDKLYGCRAIDDEGQQVYCTCIELEENGNFNCTNCFAQHSRDGQYRDYLDALRKGLNQSGVYSLKPDNMSPFKVQHCF